MNMTSKPSWHFWAIATVALLWNCMGVFDYSMTKMGVESYLAQMTPEQRAYIDGFPAWSIAFWALGVWGGLIGSLLLLFRSRWAVTAFAISLVGLLGTTIYQFGISNMPESFMAAGMMAFNALIWLVALFLFWYSRKKRSQGVLG